MEPQIVGAGGEFTRSVPINIPAFRDLPLGVSLNYNSSNISRSDVDYTVGFGWRLSATSSIERKSLGGGVPTFDDGQDLYLLDGQELMACGDTGATNPWTLRYPLRYVTDRPNASCSAGGNLTPRVETRQRVAYVAATNRFVVTQPNGVQYIYVSIGELAGDTSAAGSAEENYAKKARWLLREIRDTQATANVVQYTYAFGTKADGYAHRLVRIDYAGYTVRFEYQLWAANNIAKFATGTPLMGRQLYRLNAISVFDGATPVRAYQLLVTNSALTQTTLLTNVNEFGSNFVITNGAVTGGNSLPSEQFTYSADQVSFQTQTYPGREFHEAVTVLDTNYDGTDELVFAPETLFGQSSYDNSAIFYGFHTFMAGHYSFTRARTVVDLPALPQRCRSTYSNFSYPPSVVRRWREPVDVAGNNRGTSPLICLRHAYRYFETGTQNANIEDTLSTLNMSSGLTVVIGSKVTSNQDTSSGRAQSWRASFDLDQDTEVIFNGQIFDIVNGVFSAGASVPDVWLAPAAGGTPQYTTDFTGDGVDDRAANSLLRVVAERGFLAGTIKDRGAYKSFAVLSANFPPAFIQNLPLGNERDDFLGYGDIDGNGLTDLVFHRANLNNADTIIGYLSTGSGFSTPVTFTLPNLLSRQRSFMSLESSPRTVDHQSRVADINSDGLADLILHDGFTPITSAGAGAPYQSGKTWIFLGTGNGFVQAPVNGSLAGFDRLIATGDFDGDGLTDIALEGQTNVPSGSYVGSNPTYPTYVKQDGRIMFGNGGLPNRMTSVRATTGAVTTVAYTPSSDFGSNQMPGVQQVVKSITTDDGRGNTATTTYRYVGGAYDFINRRTLGYRTVTAYLPAIAGESVGPEVVTTYLNGNIAEYGNVKSRIVTHAGLTQSIEILDYDIVATGNGPYRARLVSQRTGTSNGGTVEGGTLVETRKQFFYQPVYGMLEAEIDYGFTTNGVNVASSDDVTTTNVSFPNISAYILDKPSYTFKQRGTSSSLDYSTWLSAQYFSYDGNGSHTQSPTRGNLTNVKVWTGDLAGTTRQQAGFTYDVFGNALTETDARGAVTTNTYDTAKSLFRISSTNALGHVTQTAWNAACQQPASQTDVNSLTTTFGYDIFCREIRRDMPNGQHVATRYLNLGVPTAQYIERDTRSASVTAGQLFALERQYFNGLGQVYKAAAPGTSTAIEDSIVQLNSYDARGNLAWQSIPMSWADAASNTATAAQRTTFRYDPLNRPLEEVYADGTYTLTKYEVASFTSSSGPNVLHPGVNVEPFSCHDGTIATPCEEVVKYTDARGNLVRQVMFDTAGTDVGTFPSTARTTDYGYDRLNQLVSILDPIGATWAYTYDAYGNRTSADDPGLGFWTMTYDPNGNLLTQTDAKGQPITFTYDALNRLALKIVGTGASRVETWFNYDQLRPGFYNRGQLTAQEIWIPANGGSTPHRIERDYHITGAVQVTRHTIDGRTYALESTFALNGAVLDQRLPNTPGSTATAWVGANSYDSASRLTGMTGLINSVTYNLRSQPLQTSFANGTSETATYNPAHGWLNSIQGVGPGATPVFTAIYSRNMAGRILRYDTGSAANDVNGAFDFAYDYAGRMTAAVNFRGQPLFDQYLTYDAGGRIRTKGPSATATTTYQYGGTGPDHAPSSTITNGTGTAFTYDANGNMLTGPNGRTMTYDGENRPLSVTFNGKRTCYVYGADGARLKKVENLSPTQDCTALPASAATTTYFGPVEVRNWLVPGSRVCFSAPPLTYPAPAIKLTNGIASYLHRDHLGSVRAITDATGARVETATYKPFGEQTEFAAPGLPAPETKGWIGERYDADAGLQYLNARYYDPVLGMFLQPDWFEVLKPGVGTNRFSYSFNDPVNFSDPLGNVADNWATKDRRTAYDSRGYKHEYTGGSGDRVSYKSWNDSGHRDYQTNYSEATSVNSNRYHGSVSAAYSTQAGNWYGEERKYSSQYTVHDRRVYDGTNGMAASGDGIFDIVGLGGAAARVTATAIAKATVQDLRGVIVYRVYGGDSRALGQSWTRIDPRTVPNYRAEAGLPTGNSGRFLIEGRLTSTTGVSTRSALPLDGNFGGLDEVLIPDAATQVDILRVFGLNPQF